MKKFILFLVTMLIIFLLAFWFTGGKKIMGSLNENKSYDFIIKDTINYSALDNRVLFCDGILTYNNQKITYLDFRNNIIWENRNRVFIDSIFIDEDKIYKCYESNIEIIDKDNHSFIITEIAGKVINVSREKNKTTIITKQNSGKNSVYLLNENNEVIVENMQFDESITGVSISEKSEAYCVSTIKYINGLIESTVSYNLIGKLEVWSEIISNEIIVKVEEINNNILVLGTENTYFFSVNGDLLWKNSNYNKIKDYLVSAKQGRIYILYNEEEKAELLCYNLEGKVKEIYKLPKNMEHFKVFNNKLYVYNSNSIFLLNDGVSNKIYDVNNISIMDFGVKGNDVNILLEDKLVLGSIK